MTDKLDRILGHRKLVWLVVLLALVMGLPSLDAGLIGDDLAQQSYVQATLAGRNPGPWWDMFVLVDGDSQRAVGLRTSGRYPWWVDPELRIAFFRPVTAATHYLDQIAWPGLLWVMHLQNVAWYVLVCALAWAFARRICESPAVAGLAGVLFTLSYAHVTPVAWLAHRNALVSTAWVLAALLAHDSWRRQGRTWAGVLAPVLLLLGLLSAEAAVAGLAFLLTFEIFIAQGSRRRRLLSLLPAVATVAVWKLGYDALGYGAVGSGAYLDPVHGGLAFVFQLPYRLGSLLTLSSGVPLVGGVPTWLWLAVAVFVAAVLVVFALVDGSRVARFGLVAAVLGLVPLTASMPGDRLLCLTSFGVALTVAELARVWVFDATPTKPKRAAGAVVLGIWALLSPIAFVVTSAAYDELRYEGEAPSYGRELPNEGLSREGLVVLHAPGFLAASHLPAARAGKGLEAPNFLWVLHAGVDAPKVERIDDRTLRVLDARGWPHDPFSRYWRDVHRKPFKVGDQVKTLDYTATIRAVEGGRATAVEFRFRTALEHPSFAWSTWDGQDFRPLAPDTFETADDG